MAQIFDVLKFYHNSFFFFFIKILSGQFYADQSDSDKRNKCRNWPLKFSKQLQISLQNKIPLPKNIFLNNTIKENDRKEAKLYWKRLKAIYSMIEKGHFWSKLNAKYARKLFSFCFSGAL